EDDGETPNTQVCFYDWDDARIIFEVRGLTTEDFYKGKLSSGGKKSGAKVGNIWYGTEGFVVSTDYQSGTAFDLNGQQIAHFRGGSYAAHFANFVQAVRSRKSTDLHADIEQGHLSSALCHLGNISYRLGTMQPLGSKPAHLPLSKEAQETYAHFEEHLKANDIKLNATHLRVGREVALDPRTEMTTDPEGNKLLTRDYRP